MQRSLRKNAQVLEIKPEIEGVRVGKIVGVEKNGEIWIDYPGNAYGAIVARLTSSVDLKSLQKPECSKQDVLLVFEDNNPELPIIIDTLKPQCDGLLDSVIEVDKPEEVTVNGNSITFNAKDEIVLRCGKASITLTRAGKILIRGSYLLNRSSGANRIKGGSVQIN